MKDIAILMSPPMVRAILREENPKTVTRRTRGLDEINQDPDNWTCETTVIDGHAHAIFTSKRSDREMRSMWSPYGRIGTRLWVRENHWMDIREKGVMGGNGIVIYEATPEIAKYERGGRLVRAKTMESVKERSRLLTREESRAAMLPKFWKQKPSIHLPRWASRITLEQVDARGPERLQDISVADIEAEGITREVVESIIQETAEKFKTKPEHWITSSTEDPCSLCRECAEKAIERFKAETGSQDIHLDGGWITQGDSMASCDECGCALENTFTTHACGFELDHFESEGFKIESPEDCYSMMRILGSDGWDGTHADRIKRMGWRILYTSIHGSGAWENNPWLWPIGFKNITPK